MTDQQKINKVQEILEKEKSTGKVSNFEKKELERFETDLIFN